MGVLRTDKKAGNYSVIANYLFKDHKLSYKARGLLATMLSLPDGWAFSIAGLAALAPDGKTSVISALKELEELGYLERCMLKNEQGQYDGCDYIVHETPFTENRNTEDRNAEDQNAE